MNRDLPSTLVERLRPLLEAFASEYLSLERAKELEGFIASELPPNHPIQELAEVLAQYRPGGGELLYSEAEVRPHVAAWLKCISEGAP